MSKKISKHKPLPWAKKQNQVATFYSKEKCGSLHFSWAIDEYWGIVTRDMILPACLLIHEALVAKKHTKKNKNYICGDNYSYYVDTDNNDEHKVIVHNTQSRDYIFIMNKKYGVWNIHIRRIWRQWDSKNCYPSEKNILKDINSVLENVNTLEDYHDDNYVYGSRHSFEFYNKRKFQIPYHTADYMTNKNLYGDARDGGYILSYDTPLPGLPEKVDGSKFAFADIEIMATCFIPSMAAGLEIVVPHLNGY